MRATLLTHPAVRVGRLICEKGNRSGVRDLTHSALRAWRIPRFKRHSRQVPRVLKRVNRLTHERWLTRAFFDPGG